MSRLAQEIWEQPDALRRTVTALKHDETLLSLPEWWQAEMVVLTGMGSSLAAAHYGAYLLTQHGHRAIAIDTAELLYYQRSLLDSHTLLVVVSQSGRSIEACKLLEFAGDRLPVLGITNTADSAVARLSTKTLHVRAGQERCASTKTYTCTLAALYVLVGALRGMLTDHVAAMERVNRAMIGLLPIWAEQAQSASAIVSGKQSVICIGRGPAFCTASAAELLFQEVAKLPARSIGGGAFRHGPLEALSDTVSYVIVEGPVATRDLDRALACEMGAAQNNLIGVSSSAMGLAFTMYTSAEADFVQPILAVVPLQLLALEAAHRRGVDPDAYRYTQKVTLYER